MADASLEARNEFTTHWKLVMAGAIGFAFASVTASSAGPFMAPLGAEFGWSRAMQSSGIGVTALLTFLLSPLFGLCIDWFGTRRMALLGTAMAAIMIASFSTATGSIANWVLLWGIYGFAALMTKSTVWSAAVSSVFASGRGLALGLTLSGTAVAQAIVPGIATGLIDAYGWRAAFISLGLGGGAIAFTFCYFFLFDGYDLAAKERQAGLAAKKGPLLDQQGLTVKQAFRSPALVLIAAATFIMMFITIALNAHQFEILRGSGVSRSSASLLVGVSGVTGVFGKLATGWLLDRYHPRWVGSITLGLSALAFLILLQPGLTTAMIIMAMAVNGYAAGTKIQIASFMVATYGGMRNFGAIFGVIASLIAAGSGLGPIAAGRVFDVFGSYNPFLWFGVCGSLLSAAMVYFVGNPPVWDELQEGRAKI